ncbi:pyrophosphatase [Methylophaga lonarensis MPL]|uniref:Pyrophosphatase n=1 Tax=Methylophaga lonarensis MPL TaxID=1286106 RepID=M7P3Q2_9GAMM|nr:nucleotide pyrophosphohydrolase [Methylophaga lonarensis]EMR14147.1 pyrophosphatase [Methylophaga lonarensis MPL]
MIDKDLLEQLIAFRRERDWEQFHRPKDLAISLSIEAAELLEWFQWRTDDEISQMLSSDKRQQLEDEIADVAVYLTYLSHDLQIDLDAVIANKLKKNAAKYPVDKVRGRADKYNEYS